MRDAPIIVKVGGSLYDLPDLGLRLRQFLDVFADHPVLVVPGGGSAARAIRELDRLHGLGEETSHWLALRALTLNAHFLAALLSPAPVIEEPATWLISPAKEKLAIIDAYAFVRWDEDLEPHRALPHSWSATSDSLAARIAGLLQADRLILLKSVTIPPGTEWKTAGQMGWVDETFAEMMALTGKQLKVEAINFRERNSERGSAPREGR